MHAPDDLSSSGRHFGFAGDVCPAPICFLKRCVLFCSRLQALFVRGPSILMSLRWRNPLFTTLGADTSGTVKTTSTVSRLRRAIILPHFSFLLMTSVQPSPNCAGINQVMQTVFAAVRNIDKGHDELGGAKWGRDKRGHEKVQFYMQNAEIALQFFEKLRNCDAIAKLQCNR